MNPLFLYCYEYLLWLYLTDYYWILRLFCWIKLNLDKRMTQTRGIYWLISHISYIQVEIDFETAIFHTKAQDYFSSKFS